jgi:hypothetical protein
MGRLIAMKQPGLDQRHRDKNGEIDRKHGNTLTSVALKRPKFRMGAVRSHKRICRSTLGAAGAASISRIPTATCWSF